MGIKYHNWVQLVKLHSKINKETSCFNTTLLSTLSHKNLFKVFSLYKSSPKGIISVTIYCQFYIQSTENLHFNPLPDNQY